jgi:hypothetical protein
VTFSFAAAIPGVALPSTFTEAFDGSAVIGYKESPPVTLNHGDSPGVFTASWTQAIGGLKLSKQKEQIECQASASATVAPAQGELATAKPGYRYKGLSTFFELRLNCPYGKFEDFSQTSTAPVLVKMEGGKQRTRLKYLDICETNGFLVKAQYWKFTEFAFESSSLYVHSLVLLPRNLRGRAIRMHFEVRQAGEKLAYGNFKVTTHSQPGRTIYQGTDAFVNYCIDTGQELRSSSGKLQCYYPGRYRATIHDAHWFS